MTRLMTPASLRRWRHDLNLTQREAATRLGIPYDTYRALENGARKIKPWLRNATKAVTDGAAA